MLNSAVPDKEETFYTDAVNYWSKVPPTIDGMLGGYGYISHTDIQGSKVLLESLFRLTNPPGKTHALDCGSGIGRISKHLLLPVFDRVDLVEQNDVFLERVKDFVGTKYRDKVGELHPVGLQYFRPEHGYDVIWCQWVMGHLRDNHLVKFLQTCSTKGLNKNGVIVLKENVTSTGEVEVDEQDSSVTRPLTLYISLFEEANLRCVKYVKQHNFPRGLYSVYMFVLKPKSNVKTEEVEA